MKIIVNGKARNIEADTLAGLLVEAGYGEALVATAVNGAFEPAGRRAGLKLNEGDEVEILAPRQGG